MQLYIAEKACDDSVQGTALGTKQLLELFNEKASASCFTLQYSVFRVCNIMKHETAPPDVLFCFF